MIKPIIIPNILFASFNKIQTPLITALAHLTMWASVIMFKQLILGEQCGKYISINVQEPNKGEYV